MEPSWLLVFISISYVSNILAASSGFYVDNGKGQTVMQRGISKREKLQFERDMLDLLGLPRKPRRQLNSTDLTSSAPKFLLDLYKSLDGSKVKNEFNLKNEDLLSIKESDSIMTFLSKNDQVNSVRHERGKRLWFNVSNVPIGDTLIGAEVRLYKIPNENEDEEPLVVTMHQVIEDLNGEKQLAFVDNVNATNDFEGWLVFNVTSAFISWIAFPSSNRGLYISVHKKSNPSHELHPEDSGIISIVYEEDIENQPFMVAFFKNNYDKPRRRIREAPKRRNRKSEPEFSYNTNPFTSEPAWTLRNCQIQSLYVNFKDLNWHEWIIAPDGYAAYYCSGLCDFPLNAHMNATNHAIVQTLVHLINPAEAPKPCCAPTKLGPVSVLYYVEDNNSSVILKKYKNMIAKSCGCH